jgi:hypothetical protein
MNVVLTAPIGVDYHWYHEDEELPGETSRTLTLDDVTQEQGCTYVCTYKYGDTLIATDSFDLDVAAEGSMPVGVWRALALLRRL